MITRILILLNSLLLIFTLKSSFDFFAIEKAHHTKVNQLPTTLTTGPDMLCDGTLGENIFDDGDFGSGLITNLPSDPFNVSPDYAYQSSPPPNDGFYTITNNTGSWGSFAASSWVPTSDNSTDPNGYMMVVNASFEPGIFYENTVDNLCEGTLYQFTADVLNLMLSGGIQPNIDFLINGQVNYSTGNVPVNGQWNTYGFTFTTPPGTNSLTLAIRNNAPGGQGNDLAIDNIEFRACGPETTVQSSTPTICAGISTTLVTNILGTQYPTPYYQWQLSTDGGSTWNDLMGENQDDLFLPTPTEGYLYRVLVSNSETTIDNPKCRIISNEYEIIISPDEYIVFDTICNGLQYQVGNSIYTSNGTYLDSLVTSSGCDSIITSNLFFIQDFGITADLEIQNPLCPNEATGMITVNSVQNGSGIYTYYLDGDPSGNFPVFENLPEGNFTLTIVDHYQCEAAYDIQLVDPEEFIIDLGEDVTVVLGEQYDIATQANFPIESYVWLNTSGFDCTTDCLSPSVFPTDDVSYQIIATDFNGCTASDSITILVDKTRKVFIPNAFSPDGDGYNDYFTIFGGIDIEEVVSFHVFDRWGGVVFSNKNFQPNDELIGWNGMVSGKKVDSGVYVYTAEILFKDGVAERFYGDVLVAE